MGIFKAPFSKAEPNSIEFNFPNGLTAVVIFKSSTIEKDKANIVKQIQGLFICGYAYASVIVYREANNQIEELTNLFAGRTTDEVNIKDASCLVELLYKVSCF